MPNNLKSGVIISEREIPFDYFDLIEKKSSKKVFSDNIYKTDLSYGKFNHCYTFGFSDVSSPGEYIIKIGSESSYPFYIGDAYPLHLHSQIAYFNNSYLPGALTGGAASVQILNTYYIESSDSTYSNFNSDSESYYDDWNDYITNEPKICGKATALFVFGFLSRVK